MAPCRCPRASRCIREPVEARTERERRRVRRGRRLEVIHRSFVIGPYVNEFCCRACVTTIVTLTQPFRILLYEILHEPFRLLRRFFPDVLRTRARIRGALYAVRRLVRNL